GAGPTVRGPRAVVAHAVRGDLALLPRAALGRAAAATVHVRLASIQQPIATARSGAHGVVGMAEEAIQAVRARGARLPSGTRTTIARAAAVLAGLAPVRDAIVAARHLAALGLTELAHTVQVAPADLIRTAFLRAGAAAVDVRLVPIRDAIVAGRLLAGAREADLALAVAARFAAEPGDAARTVAATVDVGFVAVQDAVVTARLGAPALDARAARAVVVLRAELAGR